MKIKRRELGFHLLTLTMATKRSGWGSDELECSDWHRLVRRRASGCVDRHTEKEMQGRGKLEMKRWEGEGCQFAGKGGLYFF